MVIVTPNPARISAAIILSVLGFLVVTTFFGAAVFLRGPAIDPNPIMAEQPVHLPAGQKLFVQKYEVSVAEWNACHKAGACSLSLKAPTGQSGRDFPATGLSYVDVEEYLGWINTVAEQKYRLPTIAEWAFMATEVLFEKPDPIFTDPDVNLTTDYLSEPAISRELVPQGSFQETSHGIADLDGNVWEWTQDCYSGSVSGAAKSGRCPAYFVGGEHIAAMSFLIRDPSKGGCAIGAPPAHLGMRLVSERTS